MAGFRAKQALPQKREKRTREAKGSRRGERHPHHHTTPLAHPSPHTTYTTQRRKGRRTQQRAICWLVAGFDRPFFLPLDTRFVSLSMKFQASRFSASGRKVPLEPRRSEACRSCQPMHVLSFGEGRKLKVFVSITEFCIQAFGVLTHLCFHRAFGVKSCDHGYTLRLRGRQSPLFVGWRFDKCVFGSHSKSVASAASVAYFPL